MEHGSMRWENAQIVKDGDRIVSASVECVNEAHTDVILNEDLPEAFGATLVRVINGLHHQIVESNGKSGTMTCYEMNNFYGNTMRITITKRPE